uniref:Lon N-terminal domain-containing protein n=2 Tax=Auxenochlorella protothecoides TaxID=3075 RepID=A0A1D1ZSW8_AUXPR
MMAAGTSFRVPSPRLPACGLGPRPARTLRRYGRSFPSPTRATRRESLPIFPLRKVTFPETALPLQIFEARYRVLFSTLLAGADGLEEGLISEDKPWVGTRRFGTTFVLEDGISSVGTLLEITRHRRLDDGRILISTKGRQRFKILKVVQQQPVIVCEVEYFAEEEVNSDAAASAAKDVVDLFKSMSELGGKLGTIRIPDELLLKLCTLSPASLSLWVASLFPAFPDQQQIVLQQEDAMVRLNMVRDLLSQVVKFYQAEWAVRSAFGAPEGRAGSRSGLVGPQWDVDEEDDALGGGDSSSDED